MLFENQVAFVTGASRGIGQAIALELGKNGALIAGTATTEEGAEKITVWLKEQGLKGRGFILNVAEFNSIQQCYNAIKEQFGAPAILINNAGITRDNLMLRMKDEEWDDVISTNLSAIFHMSKLCLKDMVKARYGRIISISSVVGSMGNAGQANYAAAKAGVIGFSKSLAQEVASRGITVNVVAPGFIETDMTKKLTDVQKDGLIKLIPCQCMGQSQDIAHACSFLASSAASYITGHTLHVNGGMYMN